MVAGKHREIHEVQQSKKMSPLITCRTIFGQVVRELLLGVNIFDLDFEFFGSKPTKLCGFLIGFLQLMVILIAASFLQRCTTEIRLEKNMRLWWRSPHVTTDQHHACHEFWTLLNPLLVSRCHYEHFDVFTWQDIATSIGISNFHHAFQWSSGSTVHCCFSLQWLFLTCQTTFLTTSGQVWWLLGSSSGASRTTFLLWGYSLNKVNFVKIWSTSR